MFPHRYTTDPGGPDDLRLTRTDIAHYDLRLVELSTPPASHGCSIRPYARATRSMEATMMFLYHDGRHGRGGSDVRHFPATLDRKVRRPNGAPAYYLGRPASFWITVMRPRRRAASRQLMEAAISAGNPTPDSATLQHR